MSHTLQLLATSLGLALALTSAAAAEPPPAIVDPSTLTGKVLCGYQGWFNTPTDGSGRGWVHWGRAPLGDGDWNVDLLPDVTELDPDERCDSALRHRDGTPVQVYSSSNPKTVERHFRWMRDYGIDGVLLQRFAHSIGDANRTRHWLRVIDATREGSAKYGRVWGMMYDLTDVKPGEAQKTMDDWRHLATVDRVTADPRYIHHQGKPVVVLWGIGFGNGTPAQRPDLFEDGLKLVNFLHDDPVCGGNIVVIGVSPQWVERINKGGSDAEAFRRVLLAADIIQPWNVGRYDSPEAVVAAADVRWTADLKWCAAHGRGYMPVVYPGFTWHNLRRGAAPSNQIPRLGGRFLWTQYLQARKVGATMVFQAMFDEVDEGTAIFKTSDDLPPPGQSVFVGPEGLPSDFYLRLVGQATRFIRGELTPAQARESAGLPAEIP